MIVDLTNDPTPQRDHERNRFFGGGADLRQCHDHIRDLEEELKLCKSVIGGMEAGTLKWKSKNKRATHSQYRNRHGSRKWIKKAIRRPGALRKKFAKWYGLKPKQKISRSMYAKGYKRAKARGDTRTMRQINLAKTLSKLHRRKKPKLRLIKGGRRRAKAANKRYRRKAS